MRARVTEYRRPHPRHWWQPALAGFHWRTWSSEFAGTGLLVLCGLSAVCLDFGARSPLAAAVPSHSARLLLTGILFAGSGSLVAVSPLGRLSGGHINPAVTFAFWVTGHVSRDDLFGYVAAQCAGAVAGALALRLLWGRTAASVDFGMTAPGAGVAPLEAAALEALMTAVMIATIFVMVSNARTTRFTPLVLWPLIAALVWAGAPLTGTSLNPARSLGPAVIAMDFHDYWVYVLGPLAGALLAAALAAIPGHHRLLTAKLFHDAAYPSTLRSALPIAAPTSA